MVDCVWLILDHAQPKGMVFINEDGRMVVHVFMVRTVHRDDWLGITLLMNSLNNVIIVLYWLMVGNVLINSRWRVMVLNLLMLQELVGDCCWTCQIYVIASRRTCCFLNRRATLHAEQQIKMFARGPCYWDCAALIVLRLSTSGAQGHRVAWSSWRHTAAARIPATTSLSAIGTTCGSAGKANSGMSSQSVCPISCGMLCSTRKNSQLLIDDKGGWDVPSASHSNLDSTTWLGHSW